MMFGLLRIEGTTRVKKPNKNHYLKSKSLFFEKLAERHRLVSLDRAKKRAVLSIRLNNVLLGTGTWCN